VAVDAGFRGRGIGRQMMQAAMDRAAAAGCYKLALSSNMKREEAHRFYRNLDFQQHGVSFSVPLTRRAVRAA
jgi:GNAT superfamily N-acetyltransferase